MNLSTDRFNSIWFATTHNLYLILNFYFAFFHSIVNECYHHRHTRGGEKYDGVVCRMVFKIQLKYTVENVSLEKQFQTKSENLTIWFVFFLVFPFKWKLGKYLAGVLKRVIGIGKIWHNTTPGSDSHF